LKELLRGLRENRAATDPTSEDERLLGRTYAIPFDRVWQAATRLAGGGLKGWSLWVADDREGLIEASTQFLIGPAGDVRVTIGLDHNAQTRVDLVWISRSQRGDMGRSRRSIGRFLRGLDEMLDVGPGQILDPTRAPAWAEPD
jgi:hypothetical protein